ncbi:MAG TPA: CvpA family protein [Puia sp.]|nr:CvpA family protein [Puia sp.]
MFIDIFFVIVVLAAIIKGFRKGLIVAIFSLFALFIGLAAAIKLSAVVARHLSDSGVHMSSKWLPILSFLLVFIVVVLIVRWIERMLATVVKFTLLGWVDKLGGAVLYGIVYLAIFSVILFYLTKSHVLTDNAIASSRSYPYIEPYGPYVINKIAQIIPWFKDMFVELEHFFANLAH